MPRLTLVWDDHDGPRPPWRPLVGVLLLLGLVALITYTAHR